VASIATLSEELYLSLQTAPALMAVIAPRTYTVIAAEVWDLPADVSYPVIAFSIDDERVQTPSSIERDFSAPHLKLWYRTDPNLGSKREALRMADAIRSSMNRQEDVAMTFAGLPVNLIEWISTVVDRDPLTTQWQAILEFRLVG
jgi:hypothetical protein